MVNDNTRTGLTQLWYNSIKTLFEKNRLKTVEVRVLEIHLLESRNAR